MIKLPPDITFVIQLLSFLVFWQIMKALFFLPAQKALAARAARTTGARGRAETLDTEAAELMREAGAKLALVRAAGMREADEIRRRAEADEQAILGRFRDEALAVLERERAITASQIDAARAPLEAEATRLADAVVARVLGRAT